MTLITNLRHLKRWKVVVSDESVKKQQTGQCDGHEDNGEGYKPPRLHPFEPKNKQSKSPGGKNNAKQ